MAIRVTSKTIANKFPLADLSTLPTTQQAGGKTWSNGGFLAVGTPGAVQASTLTAVSASGRVGGSIDGTFGYSLWTLAAGENKVRIGSLNGGEYWAQLGYDGVTLFSDYGVVVKNRAGTAAADIDARSINLSNNVVANYVSATQFNVGGANFIDGLNTPVTGMTFHGRDGSNGASADVYWRGGAPAVLNERGGNVYIDGGAPNGTGAAGNVYLANTRGQVYVGGSELGGNILGRIRLGGFGAGIYATGGGNLILDGGNTPSLLVTGSTFQTWAGSRITWASVANTGGMLQSTTADLGIGRNAAGVLEINSGTAADYRDLICRGITLSGDMAVNSGFDLLVSSTYGFQIPGDSVVMKSALGALTNRFGQYTFTDENGVTTASLSTVGVGGTQGDFRLHLGKLGIGNPATVLEPLHILRGTTSNIYLGSTTNNAGTHEIGFGFHTLNSKAVSIVGIATGIGGRGTLEFRVAAGTDATNAVASDTNIRLSATHVEILKPIIYAQDTLAFGNNYNTGVKAIKFTREENKAAIWSNPSGGYGGGDLRFTTSNASVATPKTFSDATVRISYAGGLILGNSLMASEPADGQLLIAGGIYASDWLKLSGTNQTTQGAAIRNGILALSSDVAIGWSTTTDPTANQSLVSITPSSGQLAFSGNIALPAAGKILRNGVAGHNIEFTSGGETTFNTNLLTTDASSTAFRMKNGSGATLWYMQGDGANYWMGLTVFQGGVRIPALSVPDNTTTLTLHGGFGGTTAGTGNRVVANGNSAGGYNPTTGSQVVLDVGGASLGTNQDWKPASGTASLTGLLIANRINTSGTYAGICRSLYIDPVLTATVGVTNIAIESTSGNVIHRGGSWTIQPPASVTPSANGDLTVEATSNTTLTFKLKGSDGVVRSGTLTLAA